MLTLSSPDFVLFIWPRGVGGGGSLTGLHAKNYDGYRKSVEMKYCIIGMKPCLMQNLSVVPFLFLET